MRWISFGLFVGTRRGVIIGVYPCPFLCPFLCGTCSGSVCWVWGRRAIWGRRVVSFVVRSSVQEQQVLPFLPPSFLLMRVLPSLPVRSSLLSFPQRQQVLLPFLQQVCLQQQASPLSSPLIPPSSLLPFLQLPASPLPSSPQLRVPSLQ